MDTHAAKSLALELMAQHGLIAQGWRFRWMRRSATRMLGKCSHRRKLILLSRFLIETYSDDEVRNTILHEIAHALTPWGGHSNYWKDMCREIGARPERLAPPLPEGYKDPW